MKKPDEWSSLELNMNDKNENIQSPDNFLQKSCQDCLANPDPSL